MERQRERDSLVSIVTSRRHLIAKEETPDVLETAGRRASVTVSRLITMTNGYSARVAIMTQSNETRRVRRPEGGVGGRRGGGGGRPR